ncbi:MAG: pirin family protein [Flavobacteriaceae bacterium]|nr:pirin family protein [Flavobacteriaceae bacterium]
MSEENSRRNFIKKAAILSSGAIIGAQSSGIAGDTDMNIRPIKRTRPLGFQWETQDPFLFCVHHEDDYPAGNAKMGPVSGLEGRNLGQDFLVKDGYRMYHGKQVPGFPGHPHRGFETITVVRKGMVDHSDSQGAAGRYGDGDVQWMTAGSGLQHAEMFPLINKDKKNPLELFQIWINLPAKSKMVDPHFKMLWSEDIPNYIYKDQSGKKTEIEVIAGSIGGFSAPTPPPNSWAANTENKVAVWNIAMEPGAQFQLPEAGFGVNRTLYFYEGSGLQINEEQLQNYHAADVDGASELNLTNGELPGKILVLQGKPIGEPVVQHGPFVMNTRAELQQAFSDFQATHFGGWPWERYDQVHDRNKGRFAQHADGRLEQKS